MNKGIDKTKEQLLAELAELRKESKKQEEKLRASNQQLDTKILQKTEELKKSEYHYQMLFNESPIPTWEEDFSQCKTFIDTLKNRNIKNFREYFKNNPDEVIEASNKIKIIDINKAAVKLHEAQSKQELLHSLTSIFTEKSYETVTEQLICIAEGKNEYESEGIVKTIAGVEKNILLKWAVVPGYEDTLEKVYVTTTDITKLKQSQELQRESENRFNTIANASPDGILISDLNGIIEFVAPQTIKMWGYSKEEFIGKHIYEVIHKNSHATVDHMIAELLKGNDLGALEYEMIRKDGTIFICEANCCLLYDKNNKPEKVLYIQRDITERRQTVESLVESEMKFRKLAESTVMGIGLYQNDYWIYANPAAEEITGYSLDELKQMKFWDLIDPEYIDLIKERGKARQKGEYVPSRYEFKINTKQGNEKWVLLTGNTIELKSGKAGLVSVLDISERKLAEEALKKSEEKYRKIFENVQDIFYQVDNEGNIIEISPSIKRYSGYSREELIGTPVTRTYNNPNDRFLLMAELEKKGEIVDYEIRLKSKSDRLIYVSLNAHILYDENKKPAGIEGSLRDITQRKQAEEAIQKNEKKYRELSKLMRLMTDNLPDMLWAKNLDNEYIFVNKAMCSKLLNAKNTEEPLGKTDMFFAQRERNAQPDNPEWHTFGEICRDSDTETIEAMKPGQFDEFGNVKGKFLFLDVHKAPLFDSDGKLIGVVGSARDVTVAKKAENQLSKLSRAVEQSPSSVAITNLEGILEYVNPKFIEITGYTPQEVIGQKSNILKSGEHSKDYYRELWETISSGKEWHGEFHNKKKDGQLFWEKASISPIFDEQGKIINYVDVAEDITERKRNEQIQNIIHHISNAVITSRSLENFLTLVKEELGKLIDTSNFFVALYDEETDYISLPFHQDEKDNSETFPAGKTLTNYVIKTRKSLLATKAAKEKLEKSGDIEPIGQPAEVWLGVPLKSENKVTGIFAVQSYDNEKAYNESDVKMLEIISHQISISLERLKAEQDLKIAKEKAEESEYKIRSMFENTQIGILYCNAEGKIQEANQVLLDIIGSPSMEATSKINLLTFKPLRDVGFAQNVEKCILKKRIVTEDTVYTSKWGKTIFMKYFLIPVILNNKVIGVWANLNNLTDLWYTQNQLKKAKEKAEESDYLKSAFLANMSHEIRTPMNGILGFTELLKEPQLTGDEKQQYIEVIERSGKRMLNTINDIIDISKIEAGQVEVVNSEVSVSKILNVQYHFFQLEAQSKGIELIYQPSSPNKELRMITDQQKLEGILTNLIKNAFKFTEAGSISFGYALKTLGEKEIVEFYVKDTGIGIPANRIEAIFKRFEQADIKDTRAFEGSGLGLAISKSYVEMMGGEISVTSKEGSGTTFTFSIPYIRIDS